jgi:hypothetical protein
MTKKLMAVLLVVAMVTLGVAPVAQAQGRPYIPGYSGTPLERVWNRNIGMSDGLFWELDSRSSARWGRDRSIWSPRGGYNYGQEFPSFFNDRSYRQYGYNNPYMYGGNDYAYDGGWRYRRHRSNEVWAAVGGGLLGFVLGRATAPKREKPQAAPAPATQTASAPETQARMQDCSVRVTNQSDASVFVGSLSGGGFTLKPGQSIEACLTPADAAYKCIDGNLVPAAFALLGETVVIR